MKFVTANGGMGSPTLGHPWSPRKHSAATIDCKRNLLEQLNSSVSCTTDDESAVDGDSSTPRTLTPTCKTWPMLSPSPVQNTTEAAGVGTERHHGNSSMQNGNMFKSPKRKRKVNDDESSKIYSEKFNDAVGHENVNTSTPVQNRAVSRRIQEVRGEGAVVSSSDGECLYPCHECGKTFDGLLDLTDHTLEHSNEKSHECDLCGELFTTKKELKKHNKTWHKEERQCDECGKVLISTTSLESHKKKHQIENVNISTEISNDIEIDQNDEITSRTLESSDKKSRECDLCGKFFATKKELKKHNEACHSKERQCDDCGKVLISTEAFENHKNKYHFENIVNISTEIAEDTGGSQNEGLAETSLEHSGEKTYECDLCGGLFVTKKNLKKHNKACHSKERQCDQCGKVLTSAEALENHKTKHHLENVANISTEILNETVGSQNEGTVEANLEHGDKTFNSEEVQCDQCRETFTSTKSLETHKKKHHSENIANISTEISKDAEENRNEILVTTHQCDLCGKSFKTAKAVENHKRKRGAHSRKELKKHKKTSTLLQQCDQCGKSFKSVDALKSHKIKRGAEHSRTSYECEKYGSKFFKEHILKMHLTQHDVRELYSCTKCTATFKDRQTLLVHLEVHRKIIQCEQCGHNFFNRSHLSEHIATTHKGLKPHKCNKCGNSFGKKYNLKRHILIKHGKKVLDEENDREKTEKDRRHKCDLCNKTFKTKLTLRRHQKFLGEKHFKCAQCSFQFGRKSDMTKHIRHMHSATIAQNHSQNKEPSSRSEPGVELGQDGGSSTEPNLTILETEDESSTVVRTDEESFPCKQCGQVFSLKVDLRDHRRRSHPTQRRYHCDRCYKSFKRKSHLDEHKELHGKPVQCKLCGNFIKMKKHLRRHMKLCQRNQSDLSTHNCEKCGELFKKKDDLDKHIKRLHNENKPRKCNMCEKSFLYESDLTRHQSTHGAVKLFSCDLCGKSFSRKYNLTRHRAAIHNCEEIPKSGTVKAQDTVKPFSCNLCKKSFGRKYHLTRHSAVHNPVRVEHLFSCDVCDKSFNRKYNLTRHRATHEEPQSSRNVSKQKPRKESGSKNNVNFSEHLETKRKRRKTKQSPPDGVNGSFQDCDMCDKFFESKHHLDKHMKRVHGGSRENYTNTLSEIYHEQNTSQKSSGKITSKNGETPQNGNPLQCNKCKRSFSHEVNLKKHMKLHYPRTGDPLACTECLKLFEDQGNWKDHMEKIHNNVIA